MRVVLKTPDTRCRGPATIQTVYTDERDTDAYEVGGYSRAGESVRRNTRAPLHCNVSPTGDNQISPYLQRPFGARARPFGPNGTSSIFNNRSRDNYSGSLRRTFRSRPDKAQGPFNRRTNLRFSRPGPTSGHCAAVIPVTRSNAGWHSYHGEKWDSNAQRGFALS